MKRDDPPERVGPSPQLARTTPRCRTCERYDRATKQCAFWNGTVYPGDGCGLHRQGGQHDLYASTDYSDP